MELIVVEETGFVSIVWKLRWDAYSAVGGRPVQLASTQFTNRGLRFSKSK